MASVCSVNKMNLGLYKCYMLPKRIVGMITTDDAFRVAKATAKSLVDSVKTTAFQNAMESIASRIYYWPPFFLSESQNTEATYQQGINGRAPTDDGTYGFRFSIKQNMCTHRAMFTHRSNGGRVMLIDRDNMLWGTFDSSGDFMGVRYSMIHTEKLQITNGTDATLSPVVIDIEDSQEIDRYGDAIDGKFIKSLMRITDATITQVGVATATTIVVDVIVDCDGTPVTGLVAADFLVYNPDGTVKAVTTIIESTTVVGRYTITGTTFVTLSTVTLKTANLLSVNGFETPISLIVVI